MVCLKHVGITDSVRERLKMSVKASRVAQWSRALHRSASFAPRDTIGLASSGLGRVWPEGYPCLIAH